jgi:hypothetical protein
MELIGTSTLAATGNVTFGSIPQGYKHLQIRGMARDAGATSGGIGVFMRLNGVTTTNYSWHSLVGTTAPPSSNATPSTTAINVGYASGNGGNYNAFSAFVIDLYDYTNSNTNKTVRSLTGISSGYSSINLHSGLYYSTGAVTQIDLYTSNGMLSGTRWSLYGVKG